MNKVNSEGTPQYLKTQNEEIYDSYLDAFRLDAVKNALGYIHGIAKDNDCFTESSVVAKYFQLQIGHWKDEKFSVAWLTNRHMLLKFETLFSGSVEGANVYIRPLLRRALHLNAAACILVHNHPSGGVIPSDADTSITRNIKEAFRYIDVRVLDHFIVGPTEDYYSYVEEGRMP